MASTSGADAVDLESIKVDLMKSITSSWEHVVKICEKNPIAHKIEISRSGNTVLHFAVESGREDIVEQLVKLINRSSEDPVDDLSVKNERGNTPLHLAASLGNIRMCECVIGDYKQLLGKRNREGETPLFLAARHGKKDAFLRLYEMCDSDTTHDYCRISSAKTHYYEPIAPKNTVLHCAIEGEYFDLAFEIIHRQEDLMDTVTDSGISPLHVLAGKPTAFRSGIYLHFFNKIIYHCIFVKELIPETSQERKNLKSLQHLGKYQTCINFFQELCKMIKLPGKSNKHLDAENPKDGQGHYLSNGAQGHQGIPSKYGGCSRFIWLIVSKTVLVILSAIMLGSNKITKLKEIKEKHLWSRQIMNKLLERTAKNEYNGATNRWNQTWAEAWAEARARARARAEARAQARTMTKAWLEDLRDKDYMVEKREVERRELEELRYATLVMEEKLTNTALASPILIAASNGIVEMVEKILQVFPLAIYDAHLKHGRNIVLLAVENRQSHVYDFLLKMTHLDKDFAFHAKDLRENNALHEVAKLQSYEVCEEFLATRCHCCSK